MDTYITQIQELDTSQVVTRVRDALSKALLNESEVDQRILGIDGMSGRKYRHFINNLVRCTPDARYLEVGSWAGSTLCSAINGNEVRATAIDNWSEFGGPKDKFSENLSLFKTPKAYVNVIESDFRAVDFTSLGKFNIYLFDGPHSEQDQFDGVEIARPALDERFVLIVDDWNWTQVRDATLRAIAKLRMSIIYGLEIRSTLDNSHPTVQRQDSDWHNGYFITVLEQPRKILRPVGIPPE